LCCEFEAGGRCPPRPREARERPRKAPSSGAGSTVAIVRAMLWLRTGSLIRADCPRCTCPGRDSHSLGDALLFGSACNLPPDLKGPAFRFQVAPHRASSSGFGPAEERVQLLLWVAPWRACGDVAVLPSNILLLPSSAFPSSSSPGDNKGFPGAWDATACTGWRAGVLRPLLAVPGPLFGAGSPSSRCRAALPCRAPSCPSYII